MIQPLQASIDLLASFQRLKIPGGYLRVSWLGLRDRLGVGRVMKWRPLGDCMLVFGNLGTHASAQLQT